MGARNDEVVTASESEIGRVGTVTQSVISEIFAKLKASAEVRAEPARLFFPNGIELIDVSVSVGLTAKGAEIKVKIAGEKGVKSSSRTADESVDVPTQPVPESARVGT